MLEKGINLITFSITCGSNQNCSFVLATIGIAIDGKKTIYAAEDRRLIKAILRAIWKNKELENINFFKKIYVAGKIIFQINYPNNLMTRESSAPTTVEH
ncbi:MAG: hypothetical protein V1770_02905 [bacterium]